MTKDRDRKSAGFGPGGRPRPNQKSQGKGAKAPAQARPNGRGLGSGAPKTGSSLQPPKRRKTRSERKKSNFFNRFTKLRHDVKTSKPGRVSGKSQAEAQVDLLIGDTRLLRSNPLSAVKEARQANYGFSLGSIFFSVLIVLLVSASIVAALYRLQIRDHEAIKAEAAKQYYTRSLDVPSRGDIYDRNGFKLASTTYLYRVGVTPKHLYSREKSIKQEQIYEKLAELLELPETEIRAAADQTEASYIQLRKDLSYDLGQELESFIQEHAIGGVRLDPEPRRTYFNEDLASQVIGFTSNDNQVLEGRLGVELSYNDLLKGERGYTYGARMNYGDFSEMPFTQSSSLAKKDGSDLYLTLDMGVQKILQEHLAEACLKYAATEDGLAIAMDPYTGEIYGMASYPYFKSSDPTAAPSKFTPEEWANYKFENLRDFEPAPYPREEGQEVSSEELANWELNQRKVNYLSREVWRNKVISDVYEAGSTFKAITAAIGLEENLTNENVSYNDAKIKVLDYWISCYSGEEGHGYVTMENGFALSCNPVFVQIALSVGIEKYYEYMEAFGFREPTGLGLVGEANCIFHDKPSLIDLATLSFGEQSPVTPIHMMRAYSALVNGGKLITPTIVKEIRTKDGRLIEEKKAEISRQVISEQTSARVRELMKKMVDSSVNYTNSGGYMVGGKTSTSVDEATGYHTISFMEAAPIDHPRLLVMFVISKPENPHIGGVEAQIVTMEASAEILEYLNIDRELDQVPNQSLTAVRMPGLIGMTYEQALERAKWFRLPLRMGSSNMTKDSLISAQSPAEGTMVFPGNAAYVYSEAYPKVQMTKLPDFIGKNAYECITEANRAGLIVDFEGDMKGTCISQLATYILPDDPSFTEHLVDQPGYELPKASVVHLALAMEGGPRE